MARYIYVYIFFFLKLYCAPFTSITLSINNVVLRLNCNNVVTRCRKDIIASLIISHPTQSCIELSGAHPLIDIMYTFKLGPSPYCSMKEKWNIIIELCDPPLVPLRTAHLYMQCFRGKGLWCEAEGCLPRFRGHLLNVLLSPGCGLHPAWGRWLWQASTSERRPESCFHRLARR